MSEPGTGDSSVVDVPATGVVQDLDEASPAATREVSTESQMSRLPAAREAYKRGDLELTRLAHQTGSSENHSTEQGQYIKAIVFGGLDGIITTFAVVASVAGADLATDVVIVMGFSNLIADGVSMGFGEYLSGKAEQQYLEQERSREVWEFENYREGELKEMIELYQEKGFTQQEAESIISIMAEKKDFFIDHMMVQELGLMPPDEDESPAKQGLAMFVSFLIFGLIPLLAYVALSTVDFDGWDPRFFIACCLTAVALFVLGAVRSKFSTMTWWASGLWVLVNGALAAGVAYLVGYVTSLIVDVEGC